MTDFKRLTDDFWVAAQIRPEDIVVAAAAGIKTVVNNRPDNEAADQPLGAEIAAAAGQAGLAYLSIPIAGPPSESSVQALAAAIQDADGPILAYCRSGTRSTTLWALATAKRGALPAERIVEAAAAAGYDLRGMLAQLRRDSTGS